MRKLLSLAILVVIAGLTGRAHAGIAGNERIELRPPSVVVEKIDPTELCPHLSLALPTLRVQAEVLLNWDECDDDGPIRLCMPEVGPEDLDLQIRWDRFLFVCGAGLQDSRANVVITPRLDCDTRESYFWVRLSYDVDEHWTVFAESFQAAGSILGMDTQHAIQGYVWDGFQMQTGVRYRWGDAWSLEGGPVFYTLSATRHPSEVGARFGFRADF